MSGQPSLLWRGVRRGVTLGALLGAVFAGFSIVGFVLVGKETFTEEIGALSPVILAHLLGGGASGLIAGLLHRWVDSGRRAAMVGAVAMIPYAAAAGVARFGSPTRWGTGELVVVLWVALAFGALLGYETWREIHRRSLRRGGDRPG